MLVKYMCGTHPIAIQTIPIRDAIALLQLSKVTGGITVRWTEDEGKYFDFIDSELYVADDAAGTVNVLVIHVEERVIQ